MTIEVSIDQASLHRLQAALDAEMDGSALKRDLTKGLREAGGPAAQAARDDILSMPGGLPHPGPSLRRSVADGVKVSASLAAGDSAGVSIKAARGGPRGFTNAPRRLAAPGGWRHPVYGNRENWVDQIGRPDWFARPIRRHADDFKAKCLDALQEMARRLAERIGNG